MKVMEERRDATPAAFKEIVAAGKPVVLRGLVADWPAAQAGRVSAEALCAYFEQFDRGAAVEELIGAPSIKGRFFYSAGDVRSLNFERRKIALRDVLNQLLALQGNASPPAIAVQSTATADCLPGFAEANAMPLLASSIAPRIWIGNAITVAAHFDPNDNIACVIGGRRRFTLLPPEQVANLYVGPLDVTPAGVPISLVDFAQPDFAKYPRFREAQAAAVVAELEPGDAIFIPYLWWHHVSSLEPFNVLVNYWWNGAQLSASPFNTLVHALLTIRNLPPGQRAAWHALFEHYVFGDDAATHLRPDEKGILGPMSPDLSRQVLAMLARSLTR